MQIANPLFPAPLDPAGEPFASWMKWIGGAEPSFNPDQPVAGFFRRRTDRIQINKLDDGTEVRSTFPVMVWYGEDADPSTGEVIPAGWCIQWGGTVDKDGNILADTGRRAHERIAGGREADAVYAFFQNSWGQMEPVPYDTFVNALRSGVWHDGVRIKPPTDQERQAATHRAEQAKAAAAIEKQQAKDEKAAAKVAAKAAAEADKLPASGHNGGPPLPETYGGMVEVIDDTVNAAREVAKAGVSTDTQAENAITIRDRLLQMGKAFEAMRVAEKKPHDDAAAAVQARYSDRLDTIKKAVVFVREAAEKHVKAKAALAAASAPEGAPAPAEAGRVASGSGRTASMTKVRVADITDAEAFAKWLVSTGNADMTALLVKIAARQASANATGTPGITIRTEERLR